jgi:hypothetical protein
MSGGGTIRHHQILGIAYTNGGYYGTFEKCDPIA